MIFAIEMTNLCKNYMVGDIVIPALKGINLQVQKGDILAIMGSSGSGKSTLMNVIGCLDKANSGEYLLDGVSVLNLNDNEDVKSLGVSFTYKKID